MINIEELIPRLGSLAWHTTFFAVGFSEKVASPALFVLAVATNFLLHVRVTGSAEKAKVFRRTVARSEIFFPDL